jgi:hypothetical protein
VFLLGIFLDQQMSPKSGYEKKKNFGGADRDRTDDLLNAIQALSQLSYSPTILYLGLALCCLGRDVKDFLSS